MHGRALMVERGSDHLPDNKWGLLAVLYALPVLIVFALFGQFSRGLTAALCTAVIIVVVRFFWYLRKHLWFWMTIMVFVALHVPLVISFPMPMTKSFTVWEVLPAVVLDFGIMYGCIKVVARAMKQADEFNSTS